MPFVKLSASLLVFAALAASGPARAQSQSESPFQNPDPRKSTAPLNPGANSFMESQAKALIESKGYSQVSSLMNDSDGIWRGTATKDDRKVDVSVDFKGHVVAQ